MLEIITLIIFVSFVFLLIETTTNSKFPVKFIYQTPDLYRYAGLYVKIHDKKYRIFKVGKL